MPRALRLSRADTALVVIDAQSRLMPAMEAARQEPALKNWLLLVETAGRLGLPVLVSEQYPKGLGNTLPVLHEALGRLTPPPTFLEKLAFSAADEPLFQRFLGLGKKRYVVVGMESHVCVYQTVRALCERGLDVHVPADAVLSRRDENRQIGLDLMREAGAVVTSTETVVFDLLGRAEGEAFKALSKLLK